jgi:hypothetical protein
MSVRAYRMPLSTWLYASPVTKPPPMMTTLFHS